MSEPDSFDNLEDVPARVARVLRREIPIRADWRAELLARVANDARHGRIGNWYARPSMLIAAGGALFLLGATLGATLGVLASRQFTKIGGVAATHDATTSMIRFVYVAPQASKVSVVGDFDGWNPAAIPLHRLSDGTWIGDVPLRPGRYAYAFMVDGSLEADPGAPRAPDGDFGVANSIVLVRGS